MQLLENVSEYIHNPYPLWEYELTNKLVSHQWDKLNALGVINLADYTIPRCIYPDSIVSVKKIPVIGASGSSGIVFQELPDFDSLQSFYEEHGLEPASESEEISNGSLAKLQSAIGVFDLLEPVKNCISTLVKSIQVLKQVDIEIDTSYSHPKIPFSVFVSVCEDDSILSNLRVAESILHEAMHLKLTLIESVVELVKPDTGNFFYSPWREEKRPAQGILHGLFVFTAIREFYLGIANLYQDNIKVVRFLKFRIEDINNEIRTLKDFDCNEDLSDNGKIIVANLLKYYFG